MDDNTYWIKFYRMLFLTLVAIACIIAECQYNRDSMFVQAGYIQDNSPVLTATGIHWTKK